MKFKIITLLFIFTITFLPIQTFSQTQAEIEQMMDGDANDKKAEKDKPKKEKSVSLKAELKKKEKELKEQEKLAKAEEKKKEKLAKAKAEGKDLKETVAEETTEVAEVKNEAVAKKSKKVKKAKANIKAEAKDADVKDETAKLNYNKLRKTADKLGTKGSYFNALEYYEQALAKAKNDNKKTQMYSQLGNANFFLRDYKAAEGYYEKAIALNSKPKKYPLLNFQLANTYKALAKYDSSIVEYKAFIEKEKSNPAFVRAVEKAKIELKGSQFAQEYVNEDPDFKIKNAGENVNGPFTDYGPEIVNNKLYFSKINSDKVIVLDDKVDEKEFSKIYFSEMNGDTLDIFQDFVENVNTSEVHVGNPSFSKDGNMVYFTKCTLNKEMQSLCKIFKSTRVNNEWSEAVELNGNINLDNTTSTQPQIIELEGSQLLYFVSNRAGGSGGKDIWYVTINKDDEYSAAKNIGSPINTAFDEVSPYFSEKTNNFYFSSNGHPSFGGLDVFKATKDTEGEWNSTVENLGFPVNSSLDDYDFILDDSETAGYLASNRIGIISLKSETCCDDIFAINPTNVDLFVTGKVFVENAQDRSVLESADLYLYDNKTDERLAEIEYKDGKAFVAELETEMDYKIVAIADGFEDAEISFKTEGISKSDTLEYNLVLKNKDLTGHILSTIYYEFDKSRLRADAPDSLRKVVSFMEAYPDVIIEIASHTDSKGTEEYNLELSERRSLSVKNYLIYQKEISEKRLVNLWFGESKPAAPNNLEDGSDNAEGRDLNRRTQFKVIGYLKAVEKEMEKVEE